jgi:hypothetical protein
MQYFSILNLTNMPMHSLITKPRVQTATNWDDTRLKIIFGMYYNRAISQLHSLYLTATSKNLKSELYAYNQLEKQSKKTGMDSAALSSQRQHFQDFFVKCYPYAAYLQRWNFAKSIMPFQQLLSRQRNMFSHSFHKPIIWHQDEQDALQQLYYKTADIYPSVLLLEKLEYQPLFSVTSNKSTGQLTFRGALFFVSLFLTRQDVNEMMDRLNELGQLFFAAEITEERRLHHIINFNPRRVLYVCWARRTDLSVLDNDTIEIKKFYDIVNYLRKCPACGNLPANSSLIEKYGNRDSDFFMYYTQQYLADFKIFNHLYFLPNGKEGNRILHNNNIDFSYYMQPQQTGNRLKGCMGQEVMERLMVQLLNKTKSPVEIENDIKKFISTYHTKPVAEINEATHPLPAAILQRKILPAQQTEVWDRMLQSRLAFVIGKIKERKSLPASASAMANYIAERWNRWLLFDAIIMNNENITAFPSEQFTKVRALLTNYKKHINNIIAELKESDRWGKKHQESYKSAKSLDELYQNVLAADLNLCESYDGPDDLVRKAHGDALAKYLSLKNPFKGTPVVQFSNNNPVPLHKKLFTGKNILEQNIGLLQLIESYYPVAERLLMPQGGEPENSKERQQLHRENRDVWKQRQQDQLLAAIAIQYLEKGLALQKRTDAVAAFSLLQVDDKIAELELKLSFKVGSVRLRTNAPKLVHFTFDEYKVASNRTVLHALKDILFTEKFAAKMEIAFTDIVDELDAYDKSQFNCINAILNWEGQVFKDNPEFKNDAKAQKGYLNFREFIAKIPGLNNAIASFIAQNKEALPFLNADKPEEAIEWLVEFRNSALHTSIPVFAYQTPANYFDIVTKFVAAGRQ